MKIPLAGKNGQVGYELKRSPQGLGEIIALNRPQMDLANLHGVRDVVCIVKSNLIAGLAAYTALDEQDRIMPGVWKD